MSEDAGEVLARGVARLRVDRGLTQEKFAEALGMSSAFVAKLEQGKKAASIATISDMCTVLGVKPSELFAAGETPKPEVSKPTDDLLRTFEKVPDDRRKAVVAILESIVRVFPDPPLPVRTRRGVRAAPKRRT